MCENYNLDSHVIDLFYSSNLPDSELCFVLYYMATNNFKIVYNICTRKFPQILQFHKSECQIIDLLKDFSMGEEESE